MPCPDFETLATGAAADHTAHCEHCRALLDALSDVDAAFDAAFAKVSAPPSLAAAVRTRVASEFPVRRPSIVPELLDFIGWAAVLTLAAILIPHFGQNAQNLLHNLLILN